MKMVLINNPCIHNEVKYNPKLSMLYIVAGFVDRDGPSYPARWHGSYQYWKSHRYFVTIFRVWSFYQGWSANQMEALRRSPLAVWNHYHHLYHSQETFQFWNLHLVPLKCSFENLNSDQSPKYFNFYLTDLYQCKLGLLQNKICIKSFFVSEVSPGSIVGHWICWIVNRSIYLTYLNIQSFLSPDGVTAIFTNVLLDWVILCSLSTRHGP